MARALGKLSALKVSRPNKPGMYADGGGLYLQISRSGTKSWIFRYWVEKSGTDQRRGTSREMGLGSLTAVDLKGAREKAAECRRLRAQGVDPIEARKAVRADAALDAARAFTFKQAANAYIAAHRSAWKNTKHAAQWKATLEAYVFPVFGLLSVQAIDIGLVLRAIEPIWTTKPETAGRVRGRIEVVLDWATARGLRKGENPARWRGHLDKLLPARSKVRKVKHFAALPYSEMPAFMAKLGEQDGIAARALEFTILTAARTGETIGATLSEIREAEKVWVIPGERMKAGREHRSPLSDRAVSVLRELAELRNDGSPFIFQGQRRRKPLSNAAMSTLLARMERTDITVHGFRSSFRDWAAERSNFPREVVEMALAHAIGDKVEAAYRRGDLFEKRRRLMAEWARYASSSATSGQIVPIRRARVIG